MTEFLIKSIVGEILFENRICESLEDQSIVDYLYKELLLERLLYGEPVTIEELRNILRKKIVNFEFIKLDGEVRPAKGTLLMNYVPQSQHPKGIRHSSPKVATFYDLQKHDWRSVSQRSKEIVLKKSEETGKPIVMVKDKPDGESVAVKGIETKGTQPIVTVDGKPITEPIKVPQKEKPEIEKIKPIEKTEGEKRYYFINPITGASKIMDITPKDTIKHLKELGSDWKLATQEEFENREDQIQQSNKETPKEIEKPIPKTKMILKNIIPDKDKDLENIDASEIE